MSHRLKIGAIIGMLALASGGGVVLAGVKQYMPLSINAAMRSANAGLAETHNTSDTDLLAECGSNATTGYCTFRDLAGTYYSCYTTDAAQIDVIRSMAADALVNVVWNASGVCTYVLSYASSRAAPRQP